MKKCVLIACAAFLAGWLSNGWRLQTNIEKKEVAMLKATREKEQHYIAEIESLQNILVERENENEKRIAKLRADIANNKLRLSVPVRECSNTANQSGETRAELDRKTADDLVSVADDGDRAIRELNYCIDAYNSLRSK